MNKKFTLGFSPCPNDCFVFDAMIHGKIDTEGMEFDVVMKDVEGLNKSALGRRKNIDITKLSYYAFARLTDDYQLLDSGSALGSGVGPILIAKQKISNITPNLRITIPGKYTTANFLFSLAFPHAKNKTEMIFSEIEDAVLTEKTDVGVIIHENRFTYEQKGLKKIIDLGEWWEKKTRMLIPLGGIAIKKNFSNEIKKKVNRVIRKSVEFALAHPKSSAGFVRENAQEMSEAVTYKHIRLYVNKFSVDLGTEGRKAVKLMLDMAIRNNMVKDVSKNIFI